MVKRQELAARCKVCVVVTKGDLLSDVDMAEIFDAITRETIAAESPRFVTADRESVAKAGADSLVSLGDGVEPLIDHLSRVESESTLSVLADSVDHEPWPILSRLWKAK